MIAQISLSDNPCCQFINDVPQWFFLLVHVAIFLVAIVLAARAFGGPERSFAWAFTLLAVAELSYLTYHVNLTLFLFAHTVSEVLVLLAIVLFGVGAVRRGLAGGSGPGAEEAARR